MLKKTGKTLLNIFITFIVLFILLTVGINYFAGLTGKVRGGEKFCINNEYSIGKVPGGDNLTFFCDNKVKNMCINGIKSYVLGNNKDLYMSFELPEFIGKNENEINDMLKVDNPKGGSYNIFQNDYNNKYYAKTYNDIVRYLKLNYNDCKIEFFSNNDLNQINIDEQKIFKDL